MQDLRHTDRFSQSEYLEALSRLWYESQIQLTEKNAYYCFCIEKTC